MTTPLPCPFCGNAGLQFREGSTFRWLIAECAKCGATQGETRIQTIGEGTPAEWVAQSKKDAIEVWNTRVVQPDCRLCHYYAGLEGCFNGTGCTNGDKYQPAPAVVLWRTE